MPADKKAGVVPALAIAVAVSGKTKIMTYQGSIYLFFFIISFGYCHGQSTDTTVDKQHIFAPVEIHPEFPGGENEMRCFIDRNINKELLTKIDTSGLIVAQFTVDTTGQVTDIRIVKSINEQIDKELLRVVSLMPEWTPGKIRDKMVEVRYNLPLRIPYEDNFCR